MKDVSVITNSLFKSTLKLKKRKNYRADVHEFSPTSLAQLTSNRCQYVEIKSFKNEYLATSKLKSWTN